MILKNALETITSDRDERCPSHVKRLANWILRSGAKPQLEIVGITEEMKILEFDDDVVAPLAWKSRSGDHIRDWYEAVSRLRKSYTDHYIPAMRVRHHLR